MNMSRDADPGGANCFILELHARFYKPTDKNALKLKYIYVICYYMRL